MAGVGVLLIVLAVALFAARSPVLAALERSAERGLGATPPAWYASGFYAVFTAVVMVLGVLLVAGVFNR
jgi:quinol-cytochrome oxidoreductase complex cytochrome b subunit